MKPQAKQRRNFMDTKRQWSLFETDIQFAVGPQNGKMLYRLRPISLFTFVSYIRYTAYISYSIEYLFKDTSSVLHLATELHFFF